MNTEEQTGTIYQYYKKISDRYFLAKQSDDRKIRHLWNPLAKEVKIPGLTGFDLFIYKDKKSLCLADGLTGALLINQAGMTSRHLRRCGRDEFIRVCEDILKRKGGAAEINVIIVTFLADYDQQISPRYKCIKV